MNKPSRIFTSLFVVLFLAGCASLVTKEEKVRLSAAALKDGVYLEKPQAAEVFSSWSDDPIFIKEDISNFPDEDKQQYQEVAKIVYNTILGALQEKGAVIVEDKKFAKTIITPGFFYSSNAASLLPRYGAWWFLTKSGAVGAWETISIKIMAISKNGKQVFGKDAQHTLFERDLEGKARGSSLKAVFDLMEK